MNCAKEVKGNYFVMSRPHIVSSTHNIDLVMFIHNLLL